MSHQGLLAVSKHGSGYHVGEMAALIYLWRQGLYKLITSYKAPAFNTVSRKIKFLTQKCGGFLSRPGLPLASGLQVVVQDMAALGEGNVGGWGSPTLHPGWQLWAYNAPRSRTSCMGHWAWVRGPCAAPRSLRMPRTRRTSLPLTNSKGVLCYQVALDISPLPKCCRGDTPGIRPVSCKVQAFLFRMLGLSGKLGFVDMLE